MAGGSDLQSSKSAKNAATCKKRQGAEVKKKKQSCDINETSLKGKNNDDNGGKKKEVDKDSKVGIKKEVKDGNKNTGAAINTKEEVLKKSDRKLSEVSVNKDKEDCNAKGAANDINKAEKCSNVNYDKGILDKNDVHKRKEASSKEADTSIKGGANVGEIKAVQSSRSDSHDVNKKEMIKESKREFSEQVNLGNKITGTTKNKDNDFCNNNNFESHKMGTEVKAVIAKEDVKKAKESIVQEDSITRGGNDSVSNGDKVLPNKSSPKKRQFGYNYRGRGSYGNNRGINFNWRGGSGYNNYNRYQNRRMMTSGPSSAYRGNDQPRSNYSKSVRGHSKSPSPFHPEAPQTFIGSLQPVYFDSQINYQDCYYFPQVWPPQQSGTYHQQILDISGAHAKVGETEVPANKSSVEDASLSTAIEVSKEHVKAENDGRKDLNHHNPPVNQESAQTETNYQVQEGHGMASNIIASVSSNPLFELGKSAEQDMQLVQTFAGIEMRPSTQLPPDYGLQWYFIPYGAALPPSVVPVMVLPSINAAGNVYQARQDGDGGRDQGFPPPQSLLPAYFNNVDLQTPSPVETLQTTAHAWSNQVMASMTAGNPPTTFH